MENKKSFFGGFLASIAISILAGTDAGKAIVKRLTDRYDLTMPGIKKSLRIFWVTEGLLLLFASVTLYAENYVTASWLFSLMGAPFLAMMFFIKALFPKSKRAIRGIAIPILMLFDVGIMGILIFAPILWTASIWVLLYISFIRMFADYGMVTGIDTNRPYSLTVTAVVLILIIHGGLSWTGYKDRIEKYHKEMYYVNLQQAATYMVVIEDITPYKLFDDELKKIASGHTTTIKRVITYTDTGTIITKGTRLKVCDWVPVVISLTGVPNIVVTTAGENGDFNPNGDDPKKLKKQFFLVPLEKLKTETEVKREFHLLAQARADSIKKAEETPVYQLLKIVGGHDRKWKVQNPYMTYYFEVSAGVTAIFNNPENKNIRGKGFDNSNGLKSKLFKWAPEMSVIRMIWVAPRDARVKIYKRIK